MSHRMPSLFMRWPTFLSSCSSGCHVGLWCQHGVLRKCHESFEEMSSNSNDRSLTFLTALLEFFDRFKAPLQTSGARSDKYTFFGQVKNLAHVCEFVWRLRTIAAHARARSRAPRFSGMVVVVRRLDSAILLR